MQYELWHVETANLIDFFEDEGEALLTAHAYMKPDDGSLPVDVLVVVRDEAGSPVRSIEGSELLQLALRRIDDDVRRSA
jgi:hypothetical protein